MWALAPSADDVRRCGEIGFLQFPTLQQWSHRTSLVLPNWCVYIRQPRHSFRGSCLLWSSWFIRSSRDLVWKRMGTASLLKMFVRTWHFCPQGLWWPWNRCPLTTVSLAQAVVEDLPNLGLLVWEVAVCPTVFGTGRAAQDSNYGPI